MANNFIPVRLEYSGGSTPTGWAEYQTGETMALPASLNFSGSGRRITGDMSNATLANRLTFQTSVADSSTTISALPNGTGQATGLNLFNTPDPDNATLAQFNVSLSQATLSVQPRGTGANLPLAVNVGGAERMRISTAGAVSIGTTSVNPVTDQVTGFAFNPTFASFNATSGTPLAIGKSTTTSGFLINFYYNGGPVGSIATNGTATAFNTSSDYRLKDDVQPLDPIEATDRVMAYEPVTWIWKTDGSYGKGFIAHKNQAIDPFTATGAKDDVERVGNIRLPDYTLVAEGVREPEDLTNYGEGAQWVFTEERPVYQGRDDSKMIPDMVAMMQRMENRIRDLEAQLQQVLAPHLAA